MPESRRPRRAGLPVIMMPKHPQQEKTMPIVINSPFSGKPVKIRDQDVGRAVKDEEGRIF